MQTRRFTILGPPPQLSRGQNAPEPAQPQLKASDIDKMMNDLSNWGRWGKEDSGAR